MPPSKFPPALDDPPSEEGKDAEEVEAIDDKDDVGDAHEWVTKSLAMARMTLHESHASSIGK